MNDAETKADSTHERLRRREPQAFAQLVADQQSIVLGLCQSLGLSGQDIDDAAAEVFANVYRALPRFEGRSALQTWVYRIACRTIPKVRARVRARRMERLEDRPIESPQPGPDRQLESAELHEQIWRTVSALDEREAMAMEMHYRRQWPIERIGEVLECPEGTVKTLLFRGRQKLKELLAAQEIGT